MNKRLTYRVLSILVGLCLLCTALHSQPHSLDAFAQERVFVHTDKPYYLTGETLWFKAYCTENGTNNLSSLSAVLYLELFNQENQPVTQIKVRLDSGTASGQIFISSSWPTGSYSLRAYTAWMRNSDEPNFYHQPILLVNALSVLSPDMYPQDTVNSILQGPVIPKQSKQIEVSTDHEVYGNRQPVLMSLMSTGSEHLTDLSVAVYPYHPSLENGFTIQSSLAGHNQNRSNLKGPETIRYFPETVGPIIYGKFQNATSSEELLVSLKGQAARIYAPIFLDANRFAVQLSREVEYNHLYFWSTDHSDIPIDIDSGFDGRSNSEPNQPVAFDPATVKFIEAQSVNMQVSNLYQEYTHIHGAPTSLNKRAVPFYGRPEFQYNLDDYTRFPDLEEVFREYIKYVSLRKLSGALKLFVWDQYSNDQSIANNIFFNQPALILLDGIAVGNLELLMEVDPLRIQHIEVVTKKYTVGNQTFYGVVNLKSYKGDFTGDEALFGVEKIAHPSIYKPLSFFQPNYESSSTNQRIPDRRNTLYWNPHVYINSTEPEQLLFYTGDATGDYQIVVTGLTATGQPIHETKIFTVRGRKMP